MKQLSIEGISLLFIHNTRLKNSYISINKEGDVILKSPSKELPFLENLIKSKYDWITKKQKLILQHKQEEEILGESIYYLGLLSPVHEHARLHTKLLKLKDATPQLQQQCYDLFLKESAKEYLQSRLEYFSKLMSLSYSAVRFRKMKRRWGSCDTKKVITFNTNLMRLLPELIDYVVVHELAHLVHMNHSPAFHDLVRSYLPNEKALRKLIKNAALM